MRFFHITVTSVCSVSVSTVKTVLSVTEMLRAPFQDFQYWSYVVDLEMTCLDLPNALCQRNATQR